MMKLPQGSYYPESLDNDENLYLVHDALRVPLGFDYHPGSSMILADGDISKFPASGIITLVEQHNSPKERAVSLYYGARTNREFTNLELLPDSIDCMKPKKITMITLQAMANHREALKEAILAIEKFLGPKHSVESEPKIGTIFGRLNFMKKILFSPKAWFEADRSIGAAPFTTKFVFTGSGNVGPVGDVTYEWKFNDEEITTFEPVVEKIFLSPGNYTVSLTVKNYYGEDTVTFVDMVKIKGQAPDQASIKFLPFENQIHLDDIIPKIRTPVNQPVLIEIPQKSVENNKKTFAGELIDPKTNKATDAVTSYTWTLSDDLPHANAHKTKALFTVGGFHDLVVRTDTDLGAYRITTYENAIDVVEPTNLWIWGNENKQRVRSYEFGLVSEVLKTSNNTYALRSSDKFIDDKPENQRQIFEFWRNNGAAKKDSLKSGEGGECLLFWASGRTITDLPDEERINFATYNGFSDHYKVEHSINRPWNWAALASNKDIYFICGLPTTEQLPTLSLTNKTKTTYNIAAEISANDTLEYSNFKNGAHDLTVNPGVFDSKYDAPYGHYSAYRTTWKDDVGYMVRTVGLGEHFAFQNFYKTEGTLGLPFRNIVKLPDMPGEGNKEGSLIGLNNGIYFFNNHGGSYCFNTTTGTWELVNSHNKIARSDLNSLLAASDLESKAYISIEDTAFFKFNELDMSYVTFSQSPINKQWLMTIF
jgi:PKD repeat protein